MPKRNQNTPEEEVVDLEDFQAGSGIGTVSVLKRMPVWTYTVAGLLLCAIVVVVGFELAYMGKIYPGVSIDGVYVGGLSQSAAAARVGSKVSAYSGGAIAVTHGATTIRIPLNGLSLAYNVDQSAKIAASFGRQGNLVTLLHQQARALFDRPTTYADYSYADSDLTPYILKMDSDVDTPDQDATLAFNGTNATANPAVSGTRLDLGSLTEALQDRLASTSESDVPAPVYQLTPAVSTSAVEASIGQISSYISSPVTLTYLGNNQTINQNTIISWIQVTSHTQPPFLQSLNVADIYPSSTTANLSLNQDAVAAYVANLAQKMDQNPINATLSYNNGNLAVVSPSQGGLSLDQQGAVNGIINALTNSSSNRTVALNLTTTTANVTEDNLADLGITTLLASGQTYFPGSPAGRLQNVRTGAAKYNDLLISPGEVFDFGAQLGEVDASTGYVPELVIEGNHEDFQYGGGLCQVCTTAFRAALAAGLPIDERENHSFAISYYQWPYSAPGVDATIYYPQVDMKFTNNTGHYILIQTIMSGDHLTFNYYGTKVESGVIRGPYFVTGSNNATQASHTVFYRDVLNNAGQVVRTDTFNSYYQPSTDFPVEGTIN